MRLPRLSWLKKPARRPLRTRSPNRFRPGFEVLEDRCVPSVFNLVVDTNSDYDVSGAGTIPAGYTSLRQAILQADAHEATNPTDTSVISFAHTLTYFDKADSSTDVVNLDNLSAHNGLPLTYDNGPAGMLPADAPLPTITGNVIIDGGRIGANPMTIDGGYDQAVPNFGVQIFTIGAGANAVIENLTLQNSDANETPVDSTFAGGEGALVQNGGTPPVGDPALGGTVQLLKDNFKNSYAQFGAALYNGAGDTMIIQGGTFFYNDAGADNSLSLDQQPPLQGQGGAIFNAGTLSFGGTNTFNSDYAPDSGGSIYNSGTMYVAGSICQFSVTQAFEGGAIYNTGTILDPMTGWSFTSNTAYDNGGAIWNNSSQSVTLANDTFDTNNAETNGGAVYNIGTGGLILNGGTFTGNKAQGIGGNGGGSGGAIYNTSTLTTSNTSSSTATTFTANSALNKGGAIWNSGAMNLNFVNITGTNGNGFDAASGGGIYNAAGTATMGNITFTTNNAGGVLLGSGNGGGLFVASGNVTLSNATFSSNTANDSGSTGRDGAAIYVNGGTLAINGTSSFTGNQAANGGAIFVNGGTLAVQSSTFTNNSATQSGGALFDKGTLTATAISLIGNSAASGGGIYNAGTSTLLNSTLADNTATNGGGAYNGSGALELVNATLSFNAASTAGGGIFNAAALSLLNTIVAENTAPLGPDIYNSAAPNGDINTNFVDKVYLDLLGRPADAGASYWIGLLNAGTPASTVVLGIESSQEYRNDLVNNLYLHYLKRAADPSGLAGWSNLLANNGTIEQVIDGIAASPEYFALNGASNGSFVAALYTDILGRTGSPAEVAGWVNVLAGGATRAQVAGAFLTSQEYRTDLVELYYQTYLGRAADSGGLSYFLGQLNAGVQDQVVLAEILGSPEGVGNQSSPSGYALLANNLIGNNTGSGIVANQGSNLVGTAAAPLNPDFASNTPASVNGSPPVLSLSSSSPAIDHGNDSVLSSPYNLATDETGALRLQGFSVDIGAVEFAVPPTSNVQTLKFSVPLNSPTPFAASDVLPLVGILYPASLTRFAIYTPAPPQLGSAVAGPQGLNLILTAFSRTQFTFSFRLSFVNTAGKLVGLSPVINGIVTVPLGGGTGGTGGTGSTGGTGTGLVVHA